MNIVIDIAIALLVFGILVAIHEFGHFSIAKLSGIKVNKFAIGMGPRLIKFQKGETEYSLRLFPVGGFCAMEGEDDDSDDPRAFRNKPVLKRIAVVVAGAIMNLILGFIVCIIMTCVMEKIPSLTISEFRENAMSAQTGLEVGDKILKLDNTNIFNDTDLSYEFGNSKDQIFDVTVKRDGKKITIPDVKFLQEYYYYYNEDGILVSVDKNKVYGENKDEELKLIASNVNKESQDEAKESDGNVLADKNTENKENYHYFYNTETEKVEFGQVKDFMDEKYMELGFAQSAFDFWVEPAEKNIVSVMSYSAGSFATLARLIWKSLIDLATGQYGISDLSGPVGIVSAIGEVRSYGLDNLLKLVAMISINLGIFNLLPIPALDGGRLVFLIIEAVRRKPVSPEKEGLVHLVFLALLMVLMVVVTISDVKKLFVN